MKVTTLLGIMLTFALCPIAQGSEQDQGPYEYKLIAIDKLPGYESGNHSLHVQPELIQAEFNKMSVGGWDFVSQINYSGPAEGAPSTIGQTYYVFKRKK